jgi:hypothetical protein
MSKQSRRKKAYKELVKVLGWSEHDRPLSSTKDERAKEQAQEAAKPEAKAIGYPRFEEGKTYKISNKGMRKTYQGEPEYCYVFRYEGKRGIHHFFREVHGGWTRTYTNAQLVGKRIEEVKE